MKLKYTCFMDERAVPLLTALHEISNRGQKSSEDGGATGLESDHRVCSISW